MIIQARGIGFERLFPFLISDEVPIFNFQFLIFN